ncbi:hypothetical protein G7084_01460 [Weissella coleopterorum]|uniref:Bacterial toxin 50 domain-containing protein n=1 Tax=Weissella coleopterorum TaxID=2714949 RepID=A0A6G8AYZ6_9LACO|nr:polymorphic toxin type 50 domain-containing protein [Weissella coleopterorum]QIL50103.1 hypothetical protein G7084_01460 [Weissella coleopterorum]
MSYEDYSDEDFENELISYIKDSKKQQEEKDAEKHKHLSEMVGGFMGLWWYLRSFRSSTVRNLKTYSAVADREAKFSIWDTMNNPKVTLINEFGACERCVPYLGQEYTLDEARSIIPIHYNCRCTFVLLDDDNGLLPGMIAGTLNGSQSDKNNEQDSGDSDYELTQEDLNRMESEALVADIPKEVFEAQNKHIQESNDYIDGRSFLLPELYKKVPGTKNKFDYTAIEELYNKHIWQADWKVSPNGNIKSIITTDQYVGYVVKRDGSMVLTKKLKIHYSLKKGGYHVVPSL